MNDTTWLRSRRCGSGACVEVARVAGGVLVRDSKQPDGPTLAFTDDQWTAFTDAVRNGDYEPAEVTA